MPTQAEIAVHLFMDVRSVYEALPKIAAQINQNPTDQKWWQNVSMDDIRRGFILHQREMAAGRGGDQATSLAKARTRESEVNTMHKELQLVKDAGVVVESEIYERELEQAINAARQQLLSISEGLKTEIDARYGIDLDASIIDESIYSALSELAGYDPEREAVDSEGVETLDATAENDNQAVG